MEFLRVGLCSYSCLLHIQYLAKYYICVVYTNLGVFEKITKVQSKLLRTLK